MALIMTRPDNTRYAIDVPVQYLYKLLEEELWEDKLTHNPLVKRIGQLGGEEGSEIAKQISRVQAVATQRKPPPTMRPTTCRNKGYL